MKRVLIAEDNHDLREIFARIFDASHFEVKLAEDGQEAVESLKNDPPDVIILDINMPKLSGFEVLAHVRRQNETRNIKVIIVTGNSIAPQDPRAQYADLVLLKPVNIAELIQFAKRLIEGEA